MFGCGSRALSGCLCYFLGKIAENHYIYKTSRNDELGAIIFIAGTVSILSRIPFIIVSHQSKRKALIATTSFKMEN